MPRGPAYLTKPEVRHHLRHTGEKHPHHFDPLQPCDLVTHHGYTLIRSGQRLPTAPNFVWYENAARAAQGVAGAVVVRVADIDRATGCYLGRRRGRRSAPRRPTA